MAFKNYIGISGFKYSTKPKMGTSNVFNGIFLDAYGEKKAVKSINKTNKGRKNNGKSKKSK